MGSERDYYRTRYQVAQSDHTPKFSLNEMVHVANEIANIREDAGAKSVDGKQFHYCDK